MKAWQYFLKGKNIIYCVVIQNIYIRKKINWKKFLYRTHWFNRANNFNWINTLIVKTIRKSNYIKLRNLNQDLIILMKSLEIKNVL